MSAPSRTPSRHGVRAEALGTTEMWLFGEVGVYGVTAQQFTADLRAARGGPVSLYVNSPGGDVFDGLAAFEALRSHPGKVTAYVDGLAASIASVIICGADEVVVSPTASIMIHEASTMTWGDQADHLASAELLGRISDTIADIYAARAGGTAASWRDRMRTETWLSASEAVDAGLADRVSEPPALGSAVARLDREAARRETGVGNLAVLVRETIRASSGSVGGVVYARAGGLARRPVGRRPVPSAMGVLRELHAARR